MSSRPLKGFFLYETVRGMKVADASLTSGWETELARIERGELSQGKFLDGVLETVNEVTGEIFRNHPVEKATTGNHINKCQSQQDKGSADSLSVLLFYMCKIRFSAFKRQKSWIASFFAARRPPLGAWLAKRKSSSLRCGIFFCQALRKKAIQGPEAYKIGKTISRWDYSFLKI